MNDTPIDDDHQQNGDSDPKLPNPDGDSDPIETMEWRESLHAVLEQHGKHRAEYLLARLIESGAQRGCGLSLPLSTPYINTIPVEFQPKYPGDRALERKIKSYIRWNAMAMVVRANRRSAGIGGHISTYASAATLMEVGFNHFFHARNDSHPGDLVYFQGHASPGIYARAFLEGRLNETHLQNFRREVIPGGGLSSYPHPWLMPEFWQFPTVSMGLTALQAIYQARFNRYLHDREILDTSRQKIWVFLGDGEMDEPESLGAITLASRENLSNLIFVVNCNLQRLDGPVRGNGKIIQELEAAFRGAGWNVIKVIWGSDWDPLLARDDEGLLVQRMGEAVDGDYQKYSVEDGAYTREHFFGRHEKLRDMVQHLSDDQIRRLGRGGHDPEKVHAAYQSAVEHDKGPTVILAKTVKGYGMGEAGEGKNITHQQKKLNDKELKEFRNRFDIPIADRNLADAPFYRPPEDSPEMRYLRERREARGGFLPRRIFAAPALPVPPLTTFKDLVSGSSEQAYSTTMAFVQILSKLLKDPRIGRNVVPIVPDEARTFGMESLFRTFGIYSHQGQVYEPVDKKLLLYYREAQNGQILEEGITEAGSMASYLAAGTSYSNHGVPMIPFFIFYSMFGFQRIGDLIWASGDLRCRGFLLGATSGRTTLNGEGLQHQDGHSHVLASTVPNCLSYDPAFAYELATIIRDGLRRMVENQDDVFYYITLGNETYPMPPMPDGCEEGILRGLYMVSQAAMESELHVNLLGSGAILNEALRAQRLLAEKFGVAANVFSATSYGELRRDALSCERWNLLHPEAPARIPYVRRLLDNHPHPVVAVSDYMKALPHGIAPWVSQPLHALGTDGYGRSDDRRTLRRFFEIDGEHVVLAALRLLVEQGRLPRTKLSEAIVELGIDPEKTEPVSH